MHLLFILPFVTQCPLIDLKAKWLVLAEQVCFLRTECMRGVKFFSDLIMCSCKTKVTNDVVHYLWVYLSCLQRFNIILT